MVYIEGNEGVEVLYLTFMVSTAKLDLQWAVIELFTSKWEGCQLDEWDSDAKSLQ